MRTALVTLRVAVKSIPARQLREVARDRAEDNTLIGVSPPTVKDISAADLARWTLATLTGSDNLDSGLAAHLAKIATADVVSVDWT